MTSKRVKFNWTDELQKAFENIKKIVFRELMLTIFDLSKPFHMYTYASDIQLGAAITQDENNIPFYSRNLNSSNWRYTTGERESFSIFDTLHELHNILLGYKIKVHTGLKTYICKKRLR
jgi:hypothetical protein